MQIQISWCLCVRSQQIWNYTLCKGRAYPGRQDRGYRLWNFLLTLIPYFFLSFQNFTQYGPNKRNCKRKQICTRWLCEAEVVTPFQNIKKRYFSYLKKSSVNKVAFFLNLFNPEFLKWTRPCLNLVRTIVSNRGLGLIGIYTVCKFFRAEMVNTCMYYEWKPLWWAKMEKQEDRKRGLS